MEQENVTNGAAELDERPASIRLDDPLQPRGPWSFWREAVAGGFGRWGLMFIFGWVALLGLCSAAWAFHLQRLAGSSSLSSYWGELLTARDVWEMLENGGLSQHPLGFWAPAITLACSIGILWAGWKLQAKAVELPSRFGPWAWGFIDALVLAWLPMSVVALAITGTFSWMASSGIQGLCWLDLAGGTLVRMTCVSAFLLQWWLCRIGRAGQASSAWHLGGLDNLLRHLGHSFLRLWMYPIQWGTLLLGGVICRTALPLMVLALAWRWGGGTPGRVWSFWLLLVLACAINAWLIGWFMRLAALFWHLDRDVRKEIQTLKAQAKGIVKA